MTGDADHHNDESTWKKWFGPHRNTHWLIAGSVAVILLGSYVVYSNRDTSPVTPVTNAAAVPTPTPAPSDRPATPDSKP